MNNQAYDKFMKYVRKPVKEDESLLLVDIDDNAMNNVPYSWQWPRYIHGDAIEVLADFGARAVIYDIEFLGNSIPGINRNEIDIVKENIQNEYGSIYDDFINITSRIAQDPAFRSKYKTSWDYFNSRLTESYGNVDADIDKITIDNDQYFAKRLKYYGKAYGTVNMLYDKYLTEKDVSEKEKKDNINKLKEYGTALNILVKNKKKYPVIKTENVAEFPADPILKEFKGVGFTMVERDKDAAIRFIDLFMEKDGYVVPQLALRPFMDIYNITPDRIDLSNPNYLVFRNIKINDRVESIKIPLIDGKMYINWPNGNYSEIFTNKNVLIEGKYYHLSYFTLLTYKDLIEDYKNEIDNILYSLNLPEAARLANDLDTFMLAKKSLVEQGTLSDEMQKEMNNAFDELLNNIGQFCSEDSLKSILNEIGKTSNLDAGAKNELSQMKENINQAVNKLRDDTGYLRQVRSDLNKIINDKICFIGLTATGTTDFSATPFDKRFSNVGTHPTLFNMLLKKNFIHIVPVWLIALISLIFFSGLIWILTNKNALVILAGCLGATSIVILVMMAIYMLTNYYASPIIPALSGIDAFIALTLFNFILTEKDKLFIKNAFDKYLSPEVIKQIIKDPSKLVLGGERKNCTAIFTDIEKFSVISENFMEDPPGLVNLLNLYLSRMSDIILENNGTIDKYEGDAIIAFFGAPHDMEDHSIRACISAIKMKQVESELNREFIEKKIINSPLRTRIGINTGDMFVGNMGTTRKFNYTMMGHAVNLASRVEGVNKLYGTYSMITEYTYEFVKDKIVCRMLDKVRVVNIKTPIRLYELICLKDQLTDELRDKLDSFDRALKEFEKHNWKKSAKLFESSRYNEGWDIAIDLYIERCKKFIKNPPPVSWDGVYNMSVK